MDHIPADLYRDIHRTIPIVCVDVVLHIDNKVLMIRRKREPANGEFWFPGGRLLKGESLKHAANRIVKSETNLNLIRPMLLGHGETKFKEDPFGHGFGTHTINFVFVSRISEINLMTILLDDNHSEAVFFSLEEICDPANKFHIYLKNFSIMAEAALE